MNARPRYLFVTGRLAESALRRQLDALAANVGFDYEVAVMPITVAALLTTDWIARRFRVPDGITKVILPGLVQGDLQALSALTAVPVEHGPNDLRELPEFFGKASQLDADYGKYDIEILAEINHAPRLGLDGILEIAEHYRASGAEIIDLGCDPGQTWAEAGAAVAMLKRHNFRVSIDSFNAAEVAEALEQGAELVLSVNGTNVADALNWAKPFPDVEVIVIPDDPRDLNTLRTTHVKLRDAGIRTRLDPILEPIGFGFAASLARCRTIREEYPEAPMMMGVGNLTELTDVDSAGMNAMLAAICQELRIHSVLTTEVANGSRSSVHEFDIARRLVHHSIAYGIVPKKFDRRLVMLRDAKLYPLGETDLAELAAGLKDDNYRIVAERGEVHLMNGRLHLRGTDAFVMMAELLRLDPTLEASHAYYLGYEMAKAVTALTLHKQYTQDRALNWGFLTRPEPTRGHATG